MSNNFFGTRGLKVGNAASIHWLTETGKKGVKLPKDFAYINYFPKFPKGIGERKVKQEILRETFLLLPLYLQGESSCRSFPM